MSSKFHFENPQLEYEFRKINKYLNDKTNYIDEISKKSVDELFIIHIGVRSGRDYDQYSIAYYNNSHFENDYKKLIKLISKKS